MSDVRRCEKREDVRCEKMSNVRRCEKMSDVRGCEKISHVRRSFICRSIYTSFFLKNPSLRRSREKEYCIDSLEREATLASDGQLDSNSVFSERGEENLIATHGAQDQVEGVVGDLGNAQRCPTGRREGHDQKPDQSSRDHKTSRKRRPCGRSIRKTRHASSGFEITSTSRAAQSSRS